MQIQAEFFSCTPTYFTPLIKESGFPRSGNIRCISVSEANVIIVPLRHGVQLHRKTCACAPPHTLPMHVAECNNVGRSLFYSSVTKFAEHSEKWRKSPAQCGLQVVTILPSAAICMPFMGTYGMKLFGKRLVIPHACLIPSHRRGQPCITRCHYLVALAYTFRVVDGRVQTDKETGRFSRSDPISAVRIKQTRRA